LLNQNDLKIFGLWGNNLKFSNFSSFNNLNGYRLNENVIYIRFSIEDEF
jgi:hypothetical protein